MTSHAAREIASGSRTGLVRLDQSKRGRRSKVNDETMIAHVRKLIEPHLADSEKVVVIGRGQKRKMMVARHLRKRKHRLFKEDAGLHSKMSWTTFRKILKWHFPHVRNPTRKTDICEHCKILRKKLFPRAVRAMDKSRAALTNLWPPYFEEFDANTTVQAKKQDNDKFPYLARFLQFVGNQNFHAPNNPARAASLNRAKRLSLHSAEAKVIHTLKQHVELVEAYRWHQISARRQEAALQRLQEGGLHRNALLIQVDFKENVRYPLSFLAA